MARGKNRSNRTEDEDAPEQPGAERSVAAHIRDRQRAVAEREASRLARPEQRSTKQLEHADRKKSAVASTPFGVHRSTLPRGEDEVEEWCGPWSVARQMIAQREEAKRKREEQAAEQEESHPLDALMEEHSLELKRKAHPSLAWKGTLPTSNPASIYAKRQKRADIQRGQRRVPSLVQLCVDFVVSNFEYVESLGDIDNDIRVDISKELVARNKLDAKAFQALVDPSMEVLEIVDCSGIPQDVLAKTIDELTCLRYLMLTHAGRVLGPKSVDCLVRSNTRLCCLAVSGAYLLTDTDAAKLIDANPTLQSLVFDTCPLLGENFVTSITKTSNLLELSLTEITLPEQSLKELASATDALRSIKNLKIKSIAGMTDGILTDILRTVGESLETLDVSYNHDLSDSCLSAIRQYNTRLRSLSMNAVKELTPAGLITLFLHPLEGLPPPPKLKVLELGSCDYHAVTDEVLDMVTASASCNTDEVLTSYASRTGGLASLDVQGSALVTDAMLEKLVETSSTTLTELNVSYCPQITDKGLGYLVAKTGNQLAKVHVWGCAQLSDEFFDGHRRTNDRTLEILGAWMKKSGTRSLR